MNRNVRRPRPKRRGWHTLTEAERGAGRHKQGRYVCSCGCPAFTSITKFEAHRSAMRRQEREGQ